MCLRTGKNLDLKVSNKHLEQFNEGKNKSKNTLVSNGPWKKQNENQVHNRIFGHSFHSLCSVRDPWEEERDTKCRISPRALEETAPQPLYLQAFSLSVLTCSTFSFLCYSITVLFLQAPGQGLWLCRDKWNFLKVISSAKKREVWSWKSTNWVCIYRMLICLLQRGSVWLIFGFLQMFHHPPGLKVGTLEWQESKRCYLN